MTNTRKRDDIWKELEFDLDIYKFFLDLLLKSSGFVFGITGAVTAYVLANSGKPFILYSLALPLLMNIAFSIVCFASVKSAVNMKEQHAEICDEVGFRYPYDLSPLSRILRFSAFIYSIISIGLIVLIMILAKSNDSSAVASMFPS